MVEPPTAKRAVHRSFEPAVAGSADLEPRTDPVELPADEVSLDRQAAIDPSAGDGERLADIRLLTLGLVTAITAATVLVLAALARGGVERVLGAAIYGASLAAVFGTSLLYRSTTEPRRRQFLRRFDHAAIFAMIAGSATPFALARGGGGAPILAALWSIAGCGIVFKLHYPIGAVRSSALVYLLLGWLSFVAVSPTLSGLGLRLIVAGGICYSAGLPFLRWWRRLPYRFAIWHGFVLAGAACHYAAIFARVVAH